jgi:hypothetical protein
VLKRLDGGVRFGSLADIKERQGHVRFTSESRHSSAPVVCPLSATSRHNARGREDNPAPPFDVHDGAEIPWMKPAVSVKLTRPQQPDGGVSAMVDLIVPAGTVLTISHFSQVKPQYGLFRMEANAKIIASIDLTIKASRAVFEEGCIIDAHGAAGANGSNGNMAAAGGLPGYSGTDGLPGRHGRKVSIEAGLVTVGELTIIANGGPGGNGGAGGAGGGSILSTPAGPGGNGGSGGRGGNGGQISIIWTRLAPHLPSVSPTSPPGHVYLSAGGQGGTGGIGGQGGFGEYPFNNGAIGSAGATGFNGTSLPV